MKFSEMNKQDQIGSIEASQENNTQERLEKINEKFDSIKDMIWEQAEFNKNKELGKYIIGDINKATHWRPLPDQNHNDSLTIGKLYRLYIDIYDNEIVLFDDEGNNSTVYSWHKGECIILEGSSQWHEYVENKKL